MAVLIAEQAFTVQTLKYVSGGPVVFIEMSEKLIPIRAVQPALVHNRWYCSRPFVLKLAVSGVPDISPVEGLRLSPEGREGSPPSTLQVYGGVPPVAARV